MPPERRRPTAAERARTDPDGDGDPDRGAWAFAAERCSIAGTLTALGDTWSILVLRELFFGVHRFNELQRDLGISRSVLTDRLARLVDLGVVRSVPYQEPGDRVRHEYRLTRAGVELLPVMVALKSWGDRHLNGGDGPVDLIDVVSGDEVGVELRTTGGRQVSPNEMRPVPRRRGPRATTP